MKTLLKLVVVAAIVFGAVKLLQKLDLIDVSPEVFEDLD